MSTEPAWKKAHRQAWRDPAGPEMPIVALVEAVSLYIVTAERSAGGPFIDYTLGPEVGRIIDGIRGLLNGDTGRLDCGLVDSTLRDLETKIGWDGDRQAMKDLVL